MLEVLQAFATEQVVEYLPALFSVIMGYAIVLLHKVLKKWNIQLNDAQVNVLEDWIERGAHYIEEKCSNLIKQNLPTMTSEEKEQELLAFVKERVPFASKVGDELLKKLIKSVLYSSYDLGAANSLKKLKDKND